MGPVLSLLNSVHISMPYFSKINFNIILWSASRSPK